MQGDSRTSSAESTALPASCLTWRVRGVPLNFDRTGLLEVLASHLGLAHTHNGVELLTLASDVRPDFQVATVRFRILPQLLAKGGRRPVMIEVPSSSENPSAGAKRKWGSPETVQLVLDHQFNGLTVLASPPPGEHRIDILAVCGLGGHPVGSFSYKGNGDGRRYMWLSDSLPRDIPGARVVTYGYDSGLQNSTSFASLHDLGGGLRDAIRSLVARGKAARLVLIGHSMGGLLIKDALLKLTATDPEMTNTVIGCLFFGVPNDGMDIESLIPMVNNQPNRALLESLAAINPQTLWRQNKSFSALLRQRDIDVYCFYETEMSPTAAKDPDSGAYKMTGPPRCLVSTTSATSCLPEETRSDRSKAMARTHSELVKFAVQDDDYNSVTYILDQLYKKCLATMDRLIASQVAGGDDTDRSQTGYCNRRGTERCEKQNRHVLSLGRNPDFVDRPEIFAEIERKFATYSRVALVGMGGIGKSQIANEYLYRLASHSGGPVFWVQGSTQEVFEQSYRHIAVKIGLPGRDDPRADAVALVSRWLTENGDWVMVMDSVDDSENARHFAQFVPPNGRILVTSRRGDVAEKLSDRHTHIPLGPMAPELASYLLRKRLRDDANDGEASELAALLEFIPLAIVQAASFINNNNGSYDLAKYTAEMQRDDGGEVGGPKPVVSTWLKSFIHIRHEAPAAAHLLSLLSFFDREEIPKSLIYGFSSGQSFPVLSSPEVSNAINLLHNFSFLSRSGSDIYSMHRLVQRTMMEWLRDNGEYEKRKTESLLGMLSIFPSADSQDWALSRTLLAHAESILKLPVQDQDRPAWVALHSAVAYYAGGWRGPVVRKQMVEVSVNETKKLLRATDNATVVMCIHRLAPVLLADGLYKEAERYARRAYNQRLATLGEKDSDTLASAASLATVLDRFGKYEEAEGLCRQAATGREERLGKSHPDTLRTFLSLAVILQGLGKYREAEEIGDAVVKLRKEALSPEHLDTLLSEASRASTYRQQGRWSEAEKAEQRVKEVMSSTLGPDHFETLAVMNNLALTYRYQGLWKDAHEIHTSVLKTRQRVLGERHPDTITSMNNLALTHRDQGQFDEARRLAERATGLRTEVLGRDHPDTLAAKNNLALIFSDQGRWDEAKELNKQVVQDRTRVLGSDHPDTLMTKANLALSYADLGNWREAEKLNKSVVKSREKTLGAEHPATLTAKANLAAIYSAANQFEKAEALEVEVMKKRRRILGPDHPDTLTSESNLAATYSNQQQWDKAESLGKQVAEARKKVLGERHPDTLMSVANLASMYSDQEKWDEAEELERQVLRDRTRILGSGHLHVLTSMSNLAFTLRALQRHDEAISYMEKCLEGIEALGTDRNWAEEVRATLSEWRNLRDE